MLEVVEIGIDFCDCFQTRLREEILYRWKTLFKSKSIPRPLKHLISSGYSHVHEDPRPEPQHRGRRLLPERRDVSDRMQLDGGPRRKLLPQQVLRVLRRVDTREQRVYGYELRFV